MTSETMVQVTEADRELFKWLIEADAETSECIDRGHAYSYEIAAIAKHRLVERDRIVAALPDEIDLFRTIKQSGARKHIDIARSIIAAHWPERGDHEQGEGR